MTCIHCGSEIRRRERRGGRCPRCGHAFAFDPGTDPYGVADADFHAAVRAVSGDGAAHFTARQLWYEVNRKWMRKGFWDRWAGWLMPLGGAGAAGLKALGIVRLGYLALVVIGVLAGMFVGAHLSGREQRRGPRPRLPKLPFDTFRRDYLARWVSVHGPLPKLVPDPDAAAPPRAVPGDVAVFSFDRAVVTQDAGTAAMLVANGFHFEHNCAVLSLDGYPFGIADTVKEMLRRNPRLTVFTLHDASAEGMELPFVLREPGWFPAPSTLIVDVGLRSYTRAWGQGELPILPGRPVRLSARVEKALQLGGPEWYEAGNRIELAAVRPAALVKMLQEPIANTGLPGDPAYERALGVASAGIILHTYMLTPPRETSSTDGFG